MPFSNEGCSRPHPDIHVRHRMHRWEIIERYVLLLIAAGLLGWAGWLFFVKTSPERATGGGALLLCAYWALWQAMYEDTLGSSVPPSLGERVMMGLWLWGRRLVLGSISALFALGAWHVAQSADVLADFGLIALFAVLSFGAGWVAVFGGGRSQSMTDDGSVHAERMRRYK
ncbi:hypothetical protein [Acidovorax sp. BL-A-41-H1]|uniref:hypothetical protein n=1 Tax=Acidovorax sp. BL-A-41-H1 TaxID=3421102 RepID=UPI003F7B1DE5